MKIFKAVQETKTNLEFQMSNCSVVLQTINPIEHHFQSLYSTCNFAPESSTEGICDRYLIQKCSNFHNSCVL